MKTTSRLFLCLFCLALPLLSGCGNNVENEKINLADTTTEQEWQMPTLPSTVPGVESLMTRGHLALEESNWSAASGFFDRALDIDAQYAPAYVGKLLAELKVRSEESLGELDMPFSDKRNFQLAVRFADDAYRTKLQGYDEKITERFRLEQERIEQERSEAAEQERQELERILQERREVAEQERIRREQNGHGNDAPSSNNPMRVVIIPISAMFRDRIVLQQIEAAMNLYRKEHRNIPTTHEEFMESIIRANDIRLPRLPSDHAYMYDPMDGQLKIRKPSGSP